MRGTSKCIKHAILQLLIPLAIQGYHQKVWASNLLYFCFISKILWSYLLISWFSGRLCLSLATYPSLGFSSFTTCTLPESRELLLGLEFQDMSGNDFEFLLDNVILETFVICYLFIYLFVTIITCKLKLCDCWISSKFVTMNKYYFPYVWILIRSWLPGSSIDWNR